MVAELKKHQGSINENNAKLKRDGQKVHVRPNNGCSHGTFGPSLKIIENIEGNGVTRIEPHISVSIK